MIIKIYEAGECLNNREQNPCHPNNEPYIHNVPYSIRKNKFLILKGPIFQTHFHHIKPHSRHSALVL